MVSFANNDDDDGDDECNIITPEICVIRVLKISVVLQV
jgi:hypothetical protein